MNVGTTTTDDAPSILALQHLAYQTEAARYDDNTLPPLLETLADLLARSEDRRFLKAVEDDQIIGSVRGFQEGDTCFVERLIVHPDYRRRGIGTTLLTEIEALFATARRFELFTGTKSESNIRLYERLGYWSVFAGACGHTYGHNSIWQMFAPGRKPILNSKSYWYEAIQAPSAAQMGILRKLIESRSFLSRVPDQSLLACDPGEGIDHLRATRGDGYAMIYSPNGRSFKVHLDRLSGKTIRASWFDPRTSSSRLVEEFTKQGDREFDPPGEPDVGNDWVLLLDDADTPPAPGGVSEKRDSTRQSEPGEQPIKSLAVAEPIRCESVYRMHLQGICTDDKFLFWSFTDVLVKTDTSGQILKKVSVANHHGDLCYLDGRITVKVLYDNYAAEKGFTEDWGFSCLITGTEKSILFDTGAKGDVLLQNMAKMNVSPDAAEAAVISHNHGDHTGGLIAVLEKNRKMTVYLPPSCTETMVQQVERLGAKVITVTKPVEICRGAFVIGPTGDKIVEQALAVDTGKGLVIITGCSHPGVIEIAKRAKEQLRRDVYMVCGGMHLLEMSDAQVGKVIAELKSLGVQKIGATHCTGEKAIALFKEAFGDGFVELGVGRVLKIESAKTYTNPVGETPIQMGDPFVLQHGGRYYLFGTNASNEGFKCLESADLVHWTPKGWAYRETENSWAKSHYWAPEVKEYRGNFYMTYSAMNKASDPPRLLIALAVSDKPQGPYRDLHAPWFDFGYSAIDGHIFVDDDDKPHLYFSRNGVQDGYSFGILYGVALADDLSKPIGEPVKLMEADQPWEKVRYAENRCNEGAFALKHRDRYYMTYSANHTGFPHYGIGYSMADKPLGPWVKANENPIAATNLDIGVSGPGHSCITYSPDGTEMFIIYHTHADARKPSGDRVVNIDRIGFDDSGKLWITGPTRSPQPMPSRSK